MKTAVKDRDRLQPFLLERLRDDQPRQVEEPPEQRVLSRAQWRGSVLRDLTWLLNTTRTRMDDATFAHAGHSVLAFGLPSWSGCTASSLQVPEMERAIRQAILDHEPRLLASTLEVEAVLEDGRQMDRHNQLRFRVSGHLWAQPAPLELALQTEVDLETGQVEIRDLRG